tara:strand:+ start:3598 stop:4755 length:1158 start_codon:yes stop_codon:yes gene_type:complete
MINKKNILFHLESRATYGYAKNVLSKFANYPTLDYCTLVTGGHLEEEVGKSLDLINTDGIRIDEKVFFKRNIKSGKCSWASGIGNAIDGYVKALNKLNPDLVLLFGDRIETLSMCMSAAYSGIPIAHVQAGDKSGHIDDSARYAIAKLAHIHFASCQDSFIRLKNLGEEEFRIYNTGAPQLDDLHSIEKGGYVFINQKKFDLNQQFILILQHPVFIESDSAYEQMEKTINTALNFQIPIIWIYPNNDIGYSKIINLLEKSSSCHKLISPIKNLNRTDYLKLLKNCKVLIGNSSSGILEAPSFNVPVINIGTRQRGRPQASNILNCSHDLKEIQDSLEIAINSKEFRNNCLSSKNPYGDGNSSERICKILSDLTLDKKLLDKITTY